MILIQTTCDKIMYRHELEEGQTHINLYSKSVLEIGRKLTHMSPYGFMHPQYGYFKNMEAYWHWCATGKRYDILRKMTAFEAKSFRKTVSAVPYDSFEEDILTGERCRLLANPELFNLLINQLPLLPLAHYFNYGGKIVDKFDKNAFWIRELDAIRRGKAVSVA